MAIEFICPSCQGTLSMADDAAGKMVRCGNCLATLRVPDAPNAEPARPDYEPPPRRPQPLYEDDDPTRDEYGEPRKRNRKVKKKGGRSAIFWILVILFGLGLFTCLACGGIMVMLGKARWTPHESPDGEYRVDFPAPLNPNIAQDAKVQLGKGERVEGAVLVGRVEFYWVWWSTFENGFQAGLNDKDILDEAVKNLTREGNATVVREAPKTVDGFNAREVVLSLAEGQVHHCLIVVGKTKLYVVAAGGPFVNEGGNARIRKFLDSFHLK